MGYGRGGGAWRAWGSCREEWGHAGRREACSGVVKMSKEFFKMIMVNSNVMILLAPCLLSTSMYVHSDYREQIT